MANINGQFDVASYYNVTARSPLDTRMLVRTLNDLTAETSWDDEHHPPYKGMLVVVQETGDVYTLLNDADVHNPESWKKSGSEGGSGPSTADSITTDVIQVNGGPLSSILNNAGIYTIDASNVQEVLSSLFCSNLWPQNIISTPGTFTVKSGIGAITISTSSSDPVEVGSEIKFNIKQSAVNGYNTTNATVAGLEYGYSKSNDDIKDGDTTSFTEQWTVNKIASEYKLTMNGGSSQSTLTGASPQNGSYTIIADIGSNTCSVTSEGSEEYSGSIKEIPVYYGVSNLGKTSEDYKSTLLTSQNKTIICSGTATGTKTITGVYPCFHNKSTSLENNASIKLVKDATVFEIENIPSEKTENKSFIFEFPNDRTIVVKSKPSILSYNYYTNISGNSLVDSINTSGTKIPSSYTIRINVPFEDNVHFKLQFPEVAEINTIKKLNTNTNQWEIFNPERYKISSGFTQNENSYKQFETKGSFLGAGSYEFTFKTPTYSIISDYKIDNFQKEINGTNYGYIRLTTNKTAEIVSRQLTLSKKTSL